MEDWSIILQAVVIYTGQPCSSRTPHGKTKEQTKLTMKPSPKTEEELQGCCFHSQ